MLDNIKIPCCADVFYFDIMLNVYVEGRGNESVGKIQCGYCSDQCWDCANLETAWQARSSLNNRATVRC